MEGKSDNERKDILDRIFRDELRHVDGKYRAEFGAFKSSMRLQKTANVLASLATNRLGDERDYRLTIRHYEMDLQYLHDECYAKRFGYNAGKTEPPEPDTPVKPPSPEINTEKTEKNQCQNPPPPAPTPRLFFSWPRRRKILTAGRHS